MLPADRLRLLRGLPGCAQLPEADLAVLAAGAWPQAYEAASPLLTEGQVVPDCYWLVESGAVEISRLDAESDGLLDYLTAGDVFDPGIPGSAAACSARTAEVTRCLLVPQSAVAARRGARAAGLGPIVPGGDLALFARRVGDLLRRAPVTVGPSTPLTEAVALMAREGVGSVIVVGDDGHPLGIVTDRDLRTRVLARGRPATAPVGDVMSHPLVAVTGDRMAWDALLEMTRRGIHHLGVLSGERLVGVVSSHDILFLQGAHPVALVRDIDAAPSLEALSGVSSRLVGAVRWLVGQGVRAADIGRVAALVNDRLVCRALDLVLARLERDGHGRPPRPFSWMAAGSEGRREQTLKTDQDNGLVYADPAPEEAGATAAYFARLADHMGDALVDLGFPRCTGGFMASNPKWCRPEATWRRYFSSWMESPEPEPLLHASLFFDVRPIAGDLAVGARLWDWVCERAPDQRLFLTYMAKAATERHVPLGLFGGFVVERGGTHKDRLDLKARGIFPMTQAMRVYGLSIGARETNTLDRLDRAAARGLFTPVEVTELSDAYEVIARLRLQHQLLCLERGAPADNFVDPRLLGKADRLLLKEAFKSIAWLQRRLEARFETQLVR